MARSGLGTVSYNPAIDSGFGSLAGNTGHNQISRSGFDAPIFYDDYGRPLAIERDSLDAIMNTFEDDPLDVPPNIFPNMAGFPSVSNFGSGAAMSPQAEARITAAAQAAANAAAARGADPAAQLAAARAAAMETAAILGVPAAAVDQAIEAAQQPVEQAAPVFDDAPLADNINEALGAALGAQAPAPALSAEAFGPPAPTTAELSENAALDAEATGLSFGDFGNFNGSINDALAGAQSVAANEGANLAAEATGQSFGDFGNLASGIDTALAIAQSQALTEDTGRNLSTFDAAQLSRAENAAQHSAQQQDEARTFDAQVALDAERGKAELSAILNSPLARAIEARENFANTNHPVHSAPQRSSLVPDTAALDSALADDRASDQAFAIDDLDAEFGAVNDAIASLDASSDISNSIGASIDRGGSLSIDLPDFGSPFDVADMGPIGLGGDPSPTVASISPAQDAEASGFGFGDMGFSSTPAADLGSSFGFAGSYDGTPSTSPVNASMDLASDFTTAEGLGAVSASDILSTIAAINEAEEATEDAALVAQALDAVGFTPNVAAPINETARAAVGRTAPTPRSTATPARSTRTARAATTPRARVAPAVTAATAAAIASSANDPDVDPAITGSVGIGGAGNPFGDGSPSPFADDGGIDTSGFGDAGGDGGGGDKVVCTAMCETYGLGEFRRKIWLEQSRGLHPAYQRGYHVLAKPMIRYAWGGATVPRRALRSMMEWAARRRTADIWKQRRGKRDWQGVLVRGVLEPLCYLVGKCVR